jgi:hypothetical protein
MDDTEDKEPPEPSVTRQRSQRDDVRAQVAGELYTTLEQLLADPELVAAVGSRRDTLNDDEILEHLRSFNRIGKVLHRPQMRRGSALELEGRGGDGGSLREATRTV